MGTRQATPSLALPSARLACRCPEPLLRPAACADKQLSRPLLRPHTLHSWLPLAALRLTAGAAGSGIRSARGWCRLPITCDAGEWRTAGLMRLRVARHPPATRLLTATGLGCPATFLAPPSPPTRRTLLTPHFHCRRPADGAQHFGLCFRAWRSSPPPSARTQPRFLLVRRGGLSGSGLGSGGWGAAVAHRRVVYAITRCAVWHTGGCVRQNRGDTACLQVDHLQAHMLRWVGGCVPLTHRPGCQLL